jgi:poly(3-hydroxybutyrate) depolymerase
MLVSLFGTVALARASADAVVLQSGKRLDHVVVSRNDEQSVVVNPWNSRQPAMTFEIPAKNCFDRAQVKEVILGDPPREEYLRRACAPGLTAAQHFELAERCRELGLKKERAFELERALELDPDHAAARAALGDSTWRQLQSARPDLRPEIAALERDYVAARDADVAAAKLAELQKAGVAGLLPRLERARRSAQRPRGLSENVPLCFGSELSPGASYCLYVPRSYDPLRPTPLVVGLHGGGPGGVDRTLVTGSGEMAMPLYDELAERYGFLVVCPTAQTAPWPDPSNEVLLASLLREIECCFDVDLDRVYLTGHSLGGYGTWHYAVKRADVWAACAPCAGGGDGPAVLRAGVPIYIYHGADDPVAPVDMDRAAARCLLAAQEKKKGSVDFAYAELDGKGHDFPDEVRDEVFRWFAGRARVPKKGDGVRPESSFDAKVTKEEIEGFGDPEHPFAAAAGEPGIPELLAELEKGGARGRRARATIAKHADDATAAIVAGVLRDPKANRDARLLATLVLGDLALPSCVRLLAPAIEDADFRVVDAAVTTLGSIDAPERVALLARASARLAGFFAASFVEGKYVVHVEYTARLKSFERFVQSCERAGQKDALLPCLERDVLVPVFTPKSPYVTPDDQDPMFEHESADARLSLVKALRSCLVAYADPRGREMLRRIRDRWSSETALVAEVDRGLAALKE